METKVSISRREVIMNLKKELSAARLTALAAPVSSFAQFDGVLSLVPPGCQKVGKCAFKNSLIFTDKARGVREAMVSFITRNYQRSGSNIYLEFVNNPRSVPLILFTGACDANHNHNPGWHRTTKHCGGVRST